MDVTCLVFYACLFGNVARANFTREFLFVTAMLAQTCYTNDFQSCYGSNSTTLLAQTCYDKKLTGLLRLDSTFNLIQPCTKLLLSSLLQPCWPTWPQRCYGLVPTARLNTVNNLLQACQSNLSTTSANTT